MHLARIVRAALAVVAALVAVGSATPVAAGAAAGCGVDYAITDQWRGGFGARVTVTNLGDPLSGWALEWSFTAGQRITSETWNGVFTQSGSTVRVTSTDYNGRLGTGRSASFGFNATWTGSNPAPASFALNGVVCTGTPVTAGTTSEPAGQPAPTSPTSEPTTATTTSTTAITTTSTPSPAPSSSAETRPPASSSAVESAAFDWPTASPKPAVVLSADVSPDSGVDALRLGLVISLLVAAVGLAVLLVVRRHLGRVGGDADEQP
ncbi:cellulose-binding domain-containing protein [Actinosynnema sp. NPDC053489]|uniref:cellulose-binding domain-containing protein n=1 Tax=Actinosynnema sp. NPDC053489 TaxID=3363916 RepID=UPI0037C5A376